jgi:hypothetical protein
MPTSCDGIQCYIPLLWTHRSPDHVIPVPCIPVGFMSLLLPRIIDWLFPLAHTMLRTLSPDVLWDPELLNIVELALASDHIKDYMGSSGTGAEAVA